MQIKKDVKVNLLGLKHSSDSVPIYLPNQQLSKTNF